MSYPKIQAYAHALNHMTRYELESLSKVDLLITQDRPEMIALLRKMNPELKVAWTIMPYCVSMNQDFNGAGPQTWWWRDLAWSPHRAQMFAAIHEDWYLKDTQGFVISDGHHHFLNWTEFCPVGRARSMPFRLPPTEGLRASEWMAKMLGHFANGCNALGPWGWEKRTCINALMLEIIADCLGSYGIAQLADADPNRDGTAEGVSKLCSQGGNEEPLTELMRQENIRFWKILKAGVPDSIPILSNDNGRYSGPVWRAEVDGIKLENWMNPHMGLNTTWGDWWNGGPLDVGYEWAERNLSVGSRYSSICYLGEDAKLTRLALGSSLLLDGYFQWQQTGKAEWFPEMQYDLGEPWGPCNKVITGIYYRMFDKGMVLVNPNPAPVGFIPAQDAVIRRWE